MDKRVVLKGRYHEQGEVHAPRDVARQDGVARVAAPHRQALALTLFEVASTHDRPQRVAGKHPPARFHLVVDIREAGKPRKPAEERHEHLEGQRVHVLAVPRDMPAAGKDEPRARTCVVEYRLRRSSRVMLDPPRNQHREHPVTPRDGFPDRFAIIRRAGNDRHALFEPVKLACAALTANANDLVAPVKRVLHHVLSELAGCPDDAHFHRALPSRPTVCHMTLEITRPRKRAKPAAAGPVHRRVGRRRADPARGANMINVMPDHVDLVQPAQPPAGVARARSVTN